MRGQGVYWNHSRSPLLEQQRRGERKSRKWRLSKALCYIPLVADEIDDDKPALPRLPVRASIYIDPDGTVQFSALFAELVPVARALGALAPERQPAKAAVSGE